jgi:nicotinate-nucleotide pyrophosphorylase (carboxylating)
MIATRPGLPGLLRSFLEEDIGRGDVTTECTVGVRTRGRGVLLTKEPLVVAGLAVAVEVFRTLDPVAEARVGAEDGERVPARAELASLSGNARALLSAERVALNLLQRMSGIATLTRTFTEAVEGTSCRILDTRKTAPGLRIFDKMAVAAGGGRNHRFGLDDGILIKDNHIRVAGGVSAAVASARRSAPALLKIEVEIETPGQLREALDAGADAILLDNRSPEELAGLVASARGRRPGIVLEASGGITIDNVRRYAETGVDFVSVGALTHSARAADISFELEAE